MPTKQNPQPSLGKYNYNSQSPSLDNTFKLSSSIESQPRRRATFSHLSQASDSERLYSRDQVQSLLDFRHENPPTTRPGTSKKLTSFLSIVIVIVAIVLQFVPIQNLWDSTGRVEGPPGVTPWSPFPDHWICPDPKKQADKSIQTFQNPVQSNMALSEAADRVAKEFDFSNEQVNKAVQEFLTQMEEGLQQDGQSMSQIPTYVTSVPNGTEEGLYMAVDLGGTNFRVCSVMLHGNSTFSLTQMKTKIPKELMVAKTSKELFGFMAKQIEAFLVEHHEEHYTGYKHRKIAGDDTSVEEVFNLGFTFSFPVTQVGINSGRLMRWTKGFDIADTLGQDVCALLQEEIDALHLPVRVAALVNDTVGTLMARSYTSPGKTRTLLGGIFGTGTNGAYVEKLTKVSKLTNNKDAAGTYDNSTGEMIINTEWGSFDNGLHVLPNTMYDKELDKDSVNPGIQMFEKRVSGMFLGEILRRAILSLIKDDSTPLFIDEHSGANELHSTTSIDSNSALYNVWGVDSSFLSLAYGDTSAGLHITRQALDKEFGISAPSVEDAQAVKVIAGAVGRRSARLAAVAIAATVINSGKLEGTTGDADEDIIDIGVDGSLVEFYPDYEELVREALRDVKEIGVEGEKRIRIGIAKDGSGVGAALIALVAGRVLRRASMVE